MCCKPFSMLNDTCLIYLLQQPLVEEQGEEPEVGDGGVATASVVLVLEQIIARNCLINCSC